VLTAAELHQRAVSAINAGRFGLSRNLLDRAIGRATDEATIASIEASLAYLEAETGDRARAMRLCERALARPGVPEETRGAIHSQLGLLLMLAGMTVEAREELDEAIRAAEACR